MTFQNRAYATIGRQARGQALLRMAQKLLIWSFSTQHVGSKHSSGEVLAFSMLALLARFELLTHFHV